MKKGGRVNPMVSGSKVLAIFGFCDVRNFTDTTEVLQEEIMIFVNNIAKIVHETVDSFNGAANKNIGDAFLLVWKIPEEIIQYNDENNNEPEIKNYEVASQIADLSLMAFIKIIVEIKKSKTLQKVILFKIKAIKINFYYSTVIMKA